MPDLPSTEPVPAGSERFEVLIAGAGVAGLEAAFALRELARDRVALTILSPNDAFVYRPMSVAEPFSSGWAQDYPLKTLADAAGATLIQDTLVEVDVAQQKVFTASGAELTYDALLLCLGATVQTRFEHATTMDDARMDELLHGLVQDIEGGYCHSLAVVIPAPIPWPLPAYELALMASERAWDMQTDVSVTLLTPEKAPLAVFGEDVSRGLDSLLAERNITVITSAYCEIPENKLIRIHPGGRSLEVDRIVALPELCGPAVIGVPSDAGGFIPVNAYAAVSVIGRVWAAGDATDYPIKHGGVSAQMADTAACSIAAAAGVPVESPTFAPELEGVLLTGGSARYLRGRSSGAQGAPAGLRKLAPDEHPPKITAKHLGSHLETLTPAFPGSPSAIQSAGVSR